MYRQIHKALSPSVMVNIFALAAMLVSTASAVPVAPRVPPGLQHFFTTAIMIDDSFDGFLRSHDTPDGPQTSIGIAGGNVTDHTGRRIGNILPKLGGELGYTDATGLYHVDIKLTIKYLDGHYGVLSQEGYSGAWSKTNVWNQVTTTLKTDSPANKNFTNRLLIGIGTRVGGFIVDNHNTVFTDHYGLPIPSS